MKKNLSFLVCALLMTSLYSENNTTPFITAEIKGLGNDTVYIAYRHVEIDEKTFSISVRSVWDTIIAENGRFQYDLQVYGTMNVHIYPKKTEVFNTNPRPFTDDLYMRSLPSRQIFLVLEPNKPLNITGQIEGTDYISYKVNQESFSADFAIDRENYKELQKKFDSLTVEIWAHTIQFINIDSITKSFDIRQTSTPLHKEQDEIKEVIDEYKLSYIRNHLDKDLSAYYLQSQDSDTFGVYYPLLTESVKKGIFEKELNWTLSMYEGRIRSDSIRRQYADNTDIGATAPDFTLPDLEGNLISLLSLKGEKYILLDFWGSWCGPCISAMPKLKDYYNTYSDKLEIVGIACNDKDEAWRNAVEKHKLNWIQLKDDESSDKAKNISTRYAVKSYPTKILLDKNLKIIATTQGAGNFRQRLENFYRKLDEVLK
ncbi:MAG: TlpA family protein disulfide reductase [Bacteroidales bacterium]|nr:TlpA family protein disulfide reductase [Bacteroidales bacterium]